MKRMKKLYSITEQTIAIIQKLAEEQCISESWALDNAILNYWRMTHKNTPIPNNPTKEIHIPKKDKIKVLKDKINNSLKFINDNKETLSDKHIKEIMKEVEQYKEELEQINGNKNDK